MKKTKTQSNPKLVKLGKIGRFQTLNLNECAKIKGGNGGNGENPPPPPPDEEIEKKV